MITNDDDTLMIISRSKKTTIFNFSLTAWGKEKGGEGGSERNTRVSRNSPSDRKSRAATLG